MKSPHLILLVALASSPVLADQPTESPETSVHPLTGGEVSLRVRYRVEGVSDQAIPSKDALASTLRTALRLRTLPYRKLRLVIEAENVAAVGNARLFRNAGAGSASNGVTDRPVVADADSTELNQIYLAGVLGKSRFTLGRQEIALGDQRHVGNVSWRQNHQSFDALTVAGDATERVAWSYSLVGRVHRIFGDSQAMTSHLLGTRINVDGTGVVTGYTYLLDYEAPNSGLSTATVGVEFSGSRGTADTPRWLYEIEYARQQDYADNPNAVDIDYANLSLGYTSGEWTVRGGWELLGGSPSDGQFRTPLATLHKFNGWADKFLATPTFGLEDSSLSLAWKGERASGSAAFHDFRASEGADDYGRELDLLATWRTRWQSVIGLKAALYEAGSLAADTDKLMLWIEHGFD